jgi:hypothetical protein
MNHHSHLTSSLLSASKPSTRPHTCRDDTLGISCNIQRLRHTTLLPPLRSSSAYLHDLLDCGHCVTVHYGARCRNGACACSCTIPVPHLVSKNVRMSAQSPFYDASFRSGARFVRFEGHLSVNVARVLKFSGEGARAAADRQGCFTLKFGGNLDRNIRREAYCTTESETNTTTSTTLIEDNCCLENFTLTTDIITSRLSYPPIATANEPRVSLSGAINTTSTTPSPPPTPTCRTRRTPHTTIERA